MNVGNYDPRAASENAFMFGSGSNQRFVSRALPDGMTAVSALPGGISGILGSPFYFNLLPDWLTDDAFQQLFTNEEIEENTLSVTRFLPAS